MSSRFSWFSSNKKCTQASSTTSTTVVRKITTNGQEVVTTYQSSSLQNEPQLLSINHTSSFLNQNNRSHDIQPISSTKLSPATNQSSIGAPISASQFEQECLNEHNRLRALHGCQPLKLNRKLCDFSTEWAKFLASRNTLQHRSNLKYGENLYQSSGKQVNGRTAVEAWYSEIKNYRYGSNSSSSNTGHFTQVVWKNSKELGVGFVQKGSSVWVVANYDPAGNYSNEYIENVPKPKK